MWAIALGIAAFAVAAYELFTREPRAALAVNDAGAKASAAIQSGAKAARERAARLSCNVSEADFDRTQRWVAESLGAGIETRDGLALMASRVAPQAWPDFAVRVGCYYARAGD